MAARMTVSLKWMLFVYRGNSLFWTDQMQNSSYLSLSIALPQRCIFYCNDVIWDKVCQRVCLVTFSKDIQKKQNYLMHPLAPKIWKTFIHGHWPVACAMAHCTRVQVTLSLVSLNFNSHMQQYTYFFLTRTRLYYIQGFPLTTVERV